MTDVNDKINCSEKIENLSGKENSLTESLWTFAVNKRIQINERKQKRVGNFTIVELLVVITIIVILAAMLLPALQKARDQASSSNCLSNLKQITFAQISYSADFQGYLGTWSNRIVYPGTTAPTGCGWSQVLGFNEYLPIPGKPGSIFYCTKLRLEKNEYFESSSATTAETSYYNNYSANFNLIVAYGSDYLVKLHMIVSPSKKLLFMDGPQRCDGSYNLLENISSQAFNHQFIRPEGHPRGLVIYPHNGKQNIGFADGHAGSLKRNELQGNYSFTYVND